MQPRSSLFASLHQPALLACSLLLFLIGPGTAAPLHAQTWTGSASMRLSGGYGTNPYLDPMLGAWDPEVAPGFGSLAPQVRLARSGSRVDLRASARSRWFPRRDDAPQFLQAAASGTVDLSDRWSAALLAGATRYRLQSARDTGWLLPSVSVRPTGASQITFRAGLSRRAERTFDPTDRQTSALAVLSGRTWLTDRLQGRLRLYRSQGRTQLADAAFGGTGVEARLTAWPHPTVSVEGALGGEQLRFDTPLSDGTVTESTDRILHGGLEVQWQAARSLRLFARTRALTADLSRSVASDIHVAAGLRVSVHRSFGGDSSPAPPRRQLWTRTGTGVRFQIPYDGDGKLYLTGDFNGWSLPGIPLQKTDTGRWTRSLDLSPGRYTYRVRIVTDDGPRWLDLPSYAQTTRDSFGGTNGVCIVQ
jgi:hypothetical protein